MNTTGDGPLTIAMMIETVILGGAEQVVFQLTDELRSRGHTVHPVVPLGEEGWLLDRFRAAGFTWHTYDLRRPIDPGLPGRLAATLKSLDVDVVHSHEFVMAIYGTPAAKRIGVPHIITMHGNQVMTKKLQRRIALRWAFRNSDATVAVSKATREHLIEALGVRPSRIRMIPNGIPVRPGDPRRFRAELGLADSDLLLVAVGSLMERKGHAILIRALAQLERSGFSRPWQLAIAGWGLERPKLEALIEELGLVGRVHLLGPRDDIPDINAAADVFVMPSLWEGLPLAILEAMFARKPIVASRTSGIPEAIDDEVHGILVEPGDVDALAGALRRVMDDAALRERLGHAALERATKEFTIAAMADAYEMLYRAR